MKDEDLENLYEREIMEDQNLNILKCDSQGVYKFKYLQSSFV